MIFFATRPTDSSCPRISPNGLPPRIYLPIVAAIAAIFLAVMAYLVAVGFGVSGTVFGKAVKSPPSATMSQGSQDAVEGGPPAARRSRSCTRCAPASPRIPTTTSH